MTDSEEKRDTSEDSACETVDNILDEIFITDSKESRDTISEIRKAVENYFERDKLKHYPFNEHNVARAIYGMDTKFGHVDVFFHAYKDKLVIHIMIPLNADKEERVKVGEFLLRANYGLKIGGFDFDFNDGEISYRISIYCGEDEFMPPTYEKIDFAVLIGISTVEKYGNALLKVMFGLVEPADAIAAVEND